MKRYSRVELKDNQKKKTCIILIIIGISMLFNYNAFAITVLGREGNLISFEEDGRLIIDEYGYSLSSSVIVRNNADKAISLDDLSLPARIYFKYIYTRKGPVIKVIKVLSKGDSEDEIPQ